MHELESSKPVSEVNLTQCSIVARAMSKKNKTGVMSDPAIGLAPAQPRILYCNQRRSASRAASKTSLEPDINIAAME
jgi:hypothetical protein